MRIIVCIKQVPDTSEVKIDPKTGTLIREGVPSIINPDDKNAIEAALRLKETAGGEVIVITMGPPQADIALREALSMGADQAYLLTDRAFAGSDTYATANALSAAIKKIKADIIFAGRQAIDGDTAQVGPEIAEALNIPQVTYALDIEVLSDGEIRVKRVLENGYEIVKVKTPCLITAVKELNEPRYMSVDGIFDSYKKEIIKLTAEELNIDKNTVGLLGSPTKVRKTFTKGIKGKGQIINFDEDSCKFILNKLIEKNLV